MGEKVSGFNLVFKFLRMVLNVDVMHDNAFLFKTVILFYDPKGFFLSVTFVLLFSVVW